MAPPEYVILPYRYEATVRAGYQARCEALEFSKCRELKALQEQHAEEISKRDLKLSQLESERSQYRREALAWRRKAVLYRMGQANAEENAQLAKSNLGALEGAMRTLSGEQEALLRCNQALQERLQTLTALCQGQHRATIAQQGQLASTDAEVKQLHNQVLQSHELSEQLSQQLADERLALEGARQQIQELRQKLSNQVVEFQAQESAHAALRAECGKLRASISEESRVRAGLEARITNLTSELQARSAELNTAEERLAQTMRVRTQQDEQLMQELERGRAADAALVKHLEQGLERLQARLEHERGEAEEQRRKLRAKLEHDAEEEQQLLRAKLEREQGLRAALEQQCADTRKQLQEGHQIHITSLAQLSRQLSDRMIDLQRANEAARRAEEQFASMEKRFNDKVRELQHATDAANRLQEQLASAEKRAAASEARVQELEAALERNAQKLCHQGSSNDAAVAGLQEQLEQQRRKLEQKEADLRDAQDAHLRQLQQLERRLAQREAAAQEQEAQLRQQLKDTRRQADCTDAQVQGQLTELQAALAARDEKIRQLTDNQVADLNQRDRLLRQLKAGHVAEIAKLEARIRELEHQLAVMPSPAEPSRHRVQSAAATVDLLVGNLLRSASDLGGGALGMLAEDDDDDRGPSADLILNMSQPHLSRDAGGLQVTETRAETNRSAPAAATAPAAAGTTYGAGGSERGTSAAAETLAEKVEASKRPADPDPDPSAERDKHPAGRGRGRKAAKVSQDQRWADAVEEAPAPAGLEDSAERADAPGQGGPATRAGGRRIAAKTGEARRKAKAAATASASDSGSEAPSVDTRGVETKAPRTRRAAQRAAAQAAAFEATTKDVSSAGQDLVNAVEVVAQPAQAAKPSRAAGGRVRGAKAAKGRQPQAAEPVPSDSGAPGEPTEPAAESKLPAASREAASLMPPPSKPAPRFRNGKAAATKPVEDEEMLPQTQDTGVAALQQPTQQPYASQPPTQPQPLHPQPPPPPPPPPQVVRLQHDGGSVTGVDVKPLPNDSQQGLPTASQTSIFSQSLMQVKGKNPLATLNPRMVEQVRKATRIVPFTAVQQWRITAPSVHRNPEGQKQR